MSLSFVLADYKTNDCGFHFEPKLGTSSVINEYQVFQIRSQELIQINVDLYYPTNNPIAKFWQPDGVFQIVVETYDRFGNAIETTNTNRYDQMDTINLSGEKVSSIAFISPYSNAGKFGIEQLSLICHQGKPSPKPPIKIR